MSRDVPPLSVCINQLNDTFSDFLISCRENTSQTTFKPLLVTAILLFWRSSMDFLLQSFFPLFFDSRNSLKTHSFTVDSSSAFAFSMAIVPPYCSHLSQAYHPHVQHSSLPVTIPASTLSII